MLYHISEEADIARFEPRTAAGIDHPVVWAVDDEHMRNYLLPRDCPRVTYYADAQTDAADIAGFLGPRVAVVAVEKSWLERIRRTILFRYHLPETTFRCVDPNAGYFHSLEPVIPERVERIDDPPAALQLRGIELSVVPSLWSLHDAVAKSTLRFSMIRMRNANARE